MLIRLKGLGFTAQFPHPWTWNNNAPSFKRNRVVSQIKWWQLFPNSRDEMTASFLVIVPAHAWMIPDILTINDSFIPSFRTFYSDPFEFLNWLISLVSVSVGEPHQPFWQTLRLTPRSPNLPSDLGPRSSHVSPHTVLTAMPLPCCLWTSLSASQPSMGRPQWLMHRMEPTSLPDSYPFLPCVAPHSTVIMPLVCHNYVMTPLGAYVTPQLLSDSWHSAEEAVQYIHPKW